MMASVDVDISFTTPLVVIHQQAERPLVAIWTFQMGNLIFKGENMASTMGVGTYATVSVEWKDKGGNVVGVEHGSVLWQSSDAATCQVTGSAGNPQIANLYAPGPIGTVEIHATGDADLGEGVKTVTATLEVEVIGGEAVAGEITFEQTPAQSQPPQAQARQQARLRR